MRRRRWVYDLGVVFCSMVAMGSVTFYMVRRSEQKWCDTLRTITSFSAPADTPVTEQQRRLGQNLIDLRKQYGC